jgi:hypothetical protein
VQPDIEEISYILVFIAASATLAGAFVFATRKTFPGFGRWTVGNLLASFCFLLFALRDFAADWLTVVAANAVCIGGAVLILEGSREFQGLQPRLKIVYAGAVACMVAILHFEYVQPSLKERVALMSLFLAAWSVIAGRTLLRFGRRPMGAGQKITVSSFALFGAIHLVRAFKVWFGPDPIDRFQGVTLGSVMIVLIPISMLAWSAGFLVLTAERDAEELSGALPQRSSAR